MNRTRYHSFGRIGILFGGPSREREVSLKSGKAVSKSLKQEGLDVIALDITTDNAEENARLITASAIDCAFIALHGYYGEDGRIQELLDTLEVPYTGSGSAASRRAMDKVASRKIFERHGLNVPRYTVIARRDVYQKSGEELYGGLTAPVVVKPAMQGSSIGVSIVKKKEEIPNAVDEALRLDERAIIEEYVSGRELTVGILAQEPLPIVEIIPEKGFFDFGAKYQKGRTEYVVPARLEEEIAKRIWEKAVLAHTLLDCYGFSRADMILNNNGEAVILEVNTIPGLTETSLLPKAAAAAGMGFTQLCIRMIELAYERQSAA